jgi:hypothetical protein
VALIKIDSQTWRRAFSRILWNGPPLTGKTTGTMTLPRPCHLVVIPGELGYSSVMPESDYHIHAWEYDPTDPKSSASASWRELQEVITAILSGKHGEVKSLVIDGLHKLYDLGMRAEGWTAASVDDEKSGRQYTKYHDKFSTFLSRVLGSGVPLVGATCYDGLEAVEPGSKITQVFPLLPGRMAKDVMGMFPVVFHTELEAGRYYWTLKAQGKMQAAGLHVPTKFIGMMPPRIEIMVDKKTGEIAGGWKEIEKTLGMLQGESGKL